MTGTLKIKQWLIVVVLLVCYCQKGNAQSSATASQMLIFVTTDQRLPDGSGKPGMERSEMRTWSGQPELQLSKEQNDDSPEKNQSGIPCNLYCNPYVIEFPKPYGYNTRMTKQYIGSIDTCNCSQYNKLKTEITNAGYNVNSLTSMNQYLWLTYKDTISTVLYQGLQNCGQIYLTNPHLDSTNSCRTVPHTFIAYGAEISPDSAWIATGSAVNFTSTVNIEKLCEPFTYQWQNSTNGSTWTNISGATGSAYSGSFTANKYVRLMITSCAGGQFFSNQSYITVLPTCNTYFTKYDTLYALPLSYPQQLPAFLMCGFNSSMYGCYNCTAFQNLDASFYTIFGRHPVFTGTITDSTTIAYNNLFAQYVNFKTGLQKTWQYYATQFTNTGCAIGGITGTGAGLSICISKVTLNDTTGLGWQPPSPCEQVRNHSIVKATLVYEQMQQQLLASFKAAYYAKCLSAAEVFTVANTVKEYHYTLYYYDQAGSLVKTIPPKGVYPVYRQTWIDSVENFKITGQQLTPPHSLPTRYCYNSLNQVNIQKSPDGGVSKFYYDRLGRLAISQNAKQAAPSNSPAGGGQYSYTKYDSLGRITEVGQLTSNTVITDATARSETSLQTWLTNAANTRNQITQTVYDVAYAPITGIYVTQQNLRNRVSYSQVWNNATDNYAASATYYSYDIHGNVDTLLQDFGHSQGIANSMNQSGNRIKRIVYNYDLISGKVNQVSYQPGAADAYYHRYQYDAENRITDVCTGRDSVMLLLFPEREAHYDYYKHGPLARMEYGQLRVQRADYAYTLQGWLKAVNPVMGGTLANGTDTTEPYPVAQDVYGFGLNYYNNDYKAIGYTPQGTTVLGALGTNAAPLYNGNIAAMVVNIPKLSAAKVYNYHYDQLNRIVGMDVFNGLNVNTGTFTAISVNDYQERVSYDPNGNILTYTRNGDAARLSMDNLSYFYKANTNQLHKVTDAAADAGANYNLYNDIKQGQANDNYQYDQIGNLVTDASESITNISWSVYGKILSVTKAGATIRYVYDASGNRIMKQTTTDTTVYVRDASGNVMSVYSKPAGGNLAQTEMHLYGSSRLGMATQHLVPDTTLILSGGFGNGIKSSFTRGEKFFELQNHLGNVLVTITDRRIQNSAGGMTVDYYAADIASANDYYPGGMELPGRSYSNTIGYRYGFNGKEKDKEGPVQYDYGFRIYDPRLVRFKSVDPLTNSYPWYTPYQFAGNKPIWCIDLDGLEEKIVSVVKPTIQNGVSIQKTLNEFKIKQAIVDDIYAAINKQIISREGDSQFRSNAEMAVIKDEISNHIIVDLDENYVAVCNPDTKEPGIFYSVLKETASFAINEAQPIAAKAAGATIYKVGDLIKKVYANAESYITKFNKKYFPNKYAAAVASKTGIGKFFGKSLKGLGTAMKALGKALDIFGTASVFYDVLNAGSPEYQTNDDFRKYTREKLKAYLELVNSQQKPTESANNQQGNSTQPATDATPSTSENTDNSKKKTSS